MALTRILLAVLILPFVLGIHQSVRGVNVFRAPLTTRTDQKRSISTSDGVFSSLLRSRTPVLLWGTVSSDDVGTVSQQILATGNRSFGITVVNSVLGYQEELTIEIESLHPGQRGAATDHSGTEALLIDNDGRKYALVCPNNASTVGCSIYLTGDDLVDVEINHNLRGRLRIDARSLAVVDPCLYEKCQCFPGDSTVQLVNRELKQMHELHLGDKVAVWKPDGSIAYEEIYSFGHQDAKAFSEFIKITMAPVAVKESTRDQSQCLELSARHFVPISSGIGEQDRAVYKRAQDVKIGDTMWAASKHESMQASTIAAQTSIVPHIVTDVSTITKQGLYNPFTMAGTIVVNNVVASVHSDWFLDAMFDTLGLTHLLPTAYQVVLSPPRILFTLIGEKLYIAMYTWLDARVNFIQLAADSSGGATYFSVGCALVAPLCLLLLLPWGSNKKMEMQKF